MIIVNQKKNSIVNFNNAQTVDRRGTQILVYIDIECEIVPIGVYGSEERATEVFDELCMCMASGQEIFEMPME